MRLGSSYSLVRVSNKSSFIFYFEEWKKERNPGASPFWSVYTSNLEDKDRETGVKLLRKSKLNTGKAKIDIPWSVTDASKGTMIWYTRGLFYATNEEYQREFNASSSFLPSHLDLSSLFVTRNFRLVF